MPIYERGQVRIHYEEAGTGFPLLLIPGWGLNSTIEFFTSRRPFNAIDEFKTEYHCIAADLRNANGGRSEGPVEIDCRTPILVLPDDVPGHPYAVAMESAMLAPNSQVSLYPWTDVPERIPLALRHVRMFLRSHRS
jgi:pimeloyl-ACP methyl ester carboxylesterase